ncbi:MAG: hypothetical protein N7Q72_07135 [Spiroplasma sp. Tabriz.8]|nr:hypothetical protein [Spiroplasma sp. Tabriz.8]
MYIKLQIFPSINKLITIQYFEYIIIIIIIIIFQLENWVLQSHFLKRISSSKFNNKK